MLAPGAAQAVAAEALVKDAPASLRAGLLDVVAQYGYFHGWLHEATGQLSRAVTLYDRALGQATEAGDADLVSELISMKGHVAWARGDVAEVVRLSRAAQRDPGVFPGQHAISAMQEARALAVLGEAAAASRKLGDGDAAAAQAACRDSDRPPWLYYHSPAFFTIQRGRVWLHLGAHDRRYTRRAVTALTAGVAELDDTGRQSEWGTNYLVWLARAHMETGELESACAVAGEAAAAARRLASPALTGSLRRLHSRMSTRWRNHPQGATLGEALR
jgi:tetratricopeptide (TPR) repeat protein